MISRSVRNGVYLPAHIDRAEFDPGRRYDPSVDPVERAHHPQNVRIAERREKAVVHLYNSTSVAQREQVFRKSKQEIIDIALSGAKLLKQCAEETEGNFQFQYSPESFTGTEIDFALDICNSVLGVWRPTAENPVIINLPATVSMSMPHVYASQIEYMSNHLNFREHVILSVHPHNDRGTGVADAELGMLAGAQRVEGTLFGNGKERET